MRPPLSPVSALRLLSCSLTPADPPSSLVTLNATPYLTEYRAGAAYQPASVPSHPRHPFPALTTAQQPPMQPLFTTSFHQPVVRPRPYPAPYSDVLPFNSQTLREAPVPAFYNYRP